MKAPLTTGFLFLLLNIISQGVFAQAENPDQRIARFTDLIVSHPEQADNYVLRSKAYNDKGSYDLALQDCETGLKLNPKLKGLYKNRGFAKIKTEKWASAVADYRQALALDAGDTTSWNNLGYVYRMLNKPDSSLYFCNKALALDPHLVMALTNRGQAYYDLKSYDEALRDYYQGLLYAPQNTDLLYKKGLTLWKLKRFDDAAADFGQVYRLDSTSANAINARGLCYQNLRKYDAAIGDFTQALRMEPDYFDAWNNRGFVYKIIGNFKMAVTDFTQAILIDPGSSDARYNRGNAYIGLKDYNNALADFTAAIKLDPKDAPAYVQRAYVFQSLNRYDSALVDDLKGTTLNPNYAEGWNGLGNTYRGLKKYEQSIRMYRKCISVDPQYVYPWYNLGLSYADLGNYDSAIANYSKTLQIDPRYFDAWNSRGNIFYYQGKYDLAISDYSETLLLDPTYVFGWTNRGNAYRTLKRFDEAYSDYRRAQELDPTYSTAYTNLATAFNMAGKPDSAIAVMNRLERIKPGDSVFFNQRGSIYYEQEKYEMAAADFTRAIQASKGFGIAWNNLGNAHFYLKKYPEAISDYTQAIRLFPGYVEALYNRANAYKKIPDNEKAIADYREVLTLSPKYTEAWNAAGNLFFNTYRYREAIPCYLKAVSIDAKYQWGWHNLGCSYRFLGISDSSLYYETKAIAVDNNYYDAYVARAQTNVDTKKYEAAMPDLEYVLGVNAKNLDALNARGLLYFYTNRYEPARADFTAILAIDKTYASAQNNLGLIAYNEEKYDESIDWYEQAKTLVPDNSRFRINQILVFLAAERFADARKAYDEYRAKKMSSYVEANKSYSFLKRYIVACTDMIAAGDYAKALPELQASLEEYKKTNELQSTFIPLAHEYAHVLKMTGVAFEKTGQGDKGLEYLKKAAIFLPGENKLASHISDLATRTVAKAEASDAGTSIKLLTPVVVSGTTVHAETAASGQVFVSGIAKDAGGLEWFKINGTDIPMKTDGYFSLGIPADSKSFTLQAYSKNGKITSQTYQFDAGQASTAGDNIPLISTSQVQNFHAVLIACSNYTGDKWPKLTTTIPEAQAYKKVLSGTYGFAQPNILELYDKGYAEILSGLSSKLESMTENDNLIIMFAGHGTYRQAGTDLIGYWVPLNATAPEIDYISNRKLDELITGCKAKHILLVSDACYSAAMRGGYDDDANATPKKYEYKFKSRQMLTSGGLEKVPGQSVFIDMVMKALQENDQKYLSIKELYSIIFKGVKTQTSREPELNEFGKEGNEGGQFYFVKKN